MSADADGLPAGEAADEPIEDAPAAAPTRTFGRIEALELLGVFLFACLEAFVGALAPHSTTSYTAAHLVSAAALFGGIGLLLWALLLRDPSWTPPLPRGRAWLWEIPLGFLLAWGVWSLASVCGRGLDAIGVHPNSSDGISAALRATALDPALRPLRIFEMFVAVTFEEVVFRVYLMHRMAQLVGRTSWMVVWVPALLFAVKHGYTLHGTVRVLVGGLAFGYVYRRTHRLPRLAFAHWMHNMTIMNFYS